MGALRTQSAKNRPAQRNLREATKCEIVQHFIKSSIGAVSAILVLAAASALAQSNLETQAPPRTQEDAQVYEQEDKTNRLHFGFLPPVDPQNRIVDGKIYNPHKSELWIDVARQVTKRCAKLKVTSVGKTSIVCDVYRQVLDDGGTYGVYRVIGEEYVKTILIYNHPAHDAMTTGTTIRSILTEPMVIQPSQPQSYAPRANKTAASATTKPFRAMRVKNWVSDGDGLVLEAYDCGIPDTVENRRAAGIPVPTSEQTAAAQRQAAAASAAKKQALDANALKSNQQQADKGDSYGLFRMGERYRDGDGVPKDLNKAREYLAKAAAAGSPGAADALSKLIEVSTNSPVAR